MTNPMMKQILPQVMSSVGLQATRDLVDNDYLSSALGPFVQMFVMEIFNFGKSEQDLKEAPSPLVGEGIRSHKLEITSST